MLTTSITTVPVPLVTFCDHEPSITLPVKAAIYSLSKPSINLLLTFEFPLGLSLRTFLLEPITEPRHLSPNPVLKTLRLKIIPLRFVILAHTSTPYTITNRLATTINTNSRSY